MNKIRQIQKWNAAELKAGINPNASWHRDFADSAFIYIGGLPFDLTEGDIITIFSQFGEPTYINLVRDKETGKSRGFCFLKYEDQRSTDLAVDNMGGAEVLGRILSVDHTRYKVKDGEVLRDNTMGDEPVVEEPEEDPESEEERPMLKEEVELQKLLRDYDDEDPMKAYMIEEKKAEVEKARAKDERRQRKEKERKGKEKKRSRREEGDRRHRRQDDSEDERDRRRRRRDDSRSRLPEQKHGRRADNRSRSRSPPRKHRRRYDSPSRSRSPKRCSRREGKSRSRSPYKQPSAKDESRSPSPYRPYRRRRSNDSHSRSPNRRPKRPRS